MSHESDVVYLIWHPLRFLETKIRQAEVSAELADYPIGTTIEDFPRLPVAEAADLLGLNDVEGVRLKDWPMSVQKQMKAGEVIHPDGRHPEHTDV